MMKNLITTTLFILTSTLSVLSQNVGISTNISYVPAYRLDIDGNLRVNSLSTGVVFSNNTGLLSSVNGTTGQVLGSGPTWIDPKTFSWTIGGNDNTSVSTNYIGTTNNTGMAFRTNNVEVMRLQSTGQLTIGSTQAGGKLDVHQSASNDVARFTTYDNANSILLRRAQTSSGSLSPTSNANIVLGRFDFEGYNGTGYTPAARMEILTDATGGTSTDMPGRIIFSTTPDGTGVLQERMRISNNGTIQFNSYTTNGILRTSASDGTITSGGLVTVSEGGTGVGTITGVVVGNGTGVMTGVTGTANQFLRRNATNTGYEFTTLTLTNGTVTNISTGTGLTGGPITSSGTISVDFGNATVAGNGLKSQGNFGQFQPHGAYSDFNVNPTYWGWNYVQGATNAPNATSSQWYRQVVSLGSEYPARGAGGYSLELAFPRFNQSASGVWMRTVENGGFGGWTRIDAGAIGSGTPNYLARWTGTNTLGIGIVQDNGARLGIGTAPHASYTVQSAGDILLNSGWLRTTGSTGWYNETHGGGWFMQDATWIRSYNNKNVYINTFLRADGGISSGAVGSSGDGTIRATSFITSDVGYRISNTAANGTYLRGNGTNYVSSTIQPGDIPAGSGNYIQNQTTSAQVGVGFWTSGTGRADAFGVSNTSSTTGKGISLYNGPTTGEPTYGLMFAGTGTFGTHGYVSADWATYLTMNTTANRGWVFRSGTTNVASINTGGNMSINGRLRLGNAANTEFYSDGNRIFARAEGSDNVAQFATYGMYLPRTGQTYNLYLGEGLQIGYNTANPILSYRSGDLLFRSDATERMRLTAAGNLGVGTTGPTQALDVRGNVYTTGQHFLQNTSPTIYLQDTDHRSGMIHMNSNLLYFLSGSATNSTTWAVNNSEWPMTINMTNDAVSVGGVMSVGDWGGCGSDYRIRIGEYSGCEPLIQPGVTGWGYVGTPTLAFYRMYSVRSYTSDGFWSFSDERLKTNVKPIENPLNKIMNLKGVTYDNREGSQIYDQRESVNNIEKYGFIAQNVMNIIPSAVSPINMTDTNESGQEYSQDKNSISDQVKTYLGVNYSAIIPILVEAMKEQQILINQLQGEVSILKLELNK